MILKAFLNAMKKNKKKFKKSVDKNIEWEYNTNCSRGAVSYTHLQKNKEYIVKIVDNGFEGEGIAKIEGYTIFIPNAIKGEKVKVLILKVLTSHAFGKVIEIIQKSPYRKDSDCGTYKRCGGCNLRHIQYQKTLEIKQNAVQSLVNKTLKTKIKVEKVVEMKQPYYYRNKAQYPVGCLLYTSQVWQKKKYQS